MGIDQTINGLIEKIESGKGKDLKVYGELSPVYHYLYGSSYDYEGQADFIEEAVPRTVSTVIDGGCGTGGLTGILAERFPDSEVIGVDLNDRMLSVARENDLRDNLSFIQSDLIELDKKTDLYTLFGTVNHFDEESITDLFETIADNLKDNGVLVLDYKSPRTKKHENGHVNYWGRETDEYIIENPIMTIYDDQGQSHYVLSFSFENKETGEKHFAGDMMPIYLYTAEEIKSMLESQGFSDVEVTKDVLDQSGVIVARK